MKNRFIVIYTFFASAVFIFAVGFFAFNLFNEYKTNVEKSETKYTELVSNIRVLSNNYEENTSAYASAIKDSIGDSGAFSYIQVRRNNETVVLFPTGKSKEETVSKLTKSFNTSFTLNKQQVSVECNLYLIRPDSIFYFARISFLMILIITIITIIMIIYLNLSEAGSDVISLEEEADQTSLENEASEEDITEEEASEEEDEKEEKGEEEESYGQQDIPDYFDEVGLNTESDEDSEEVTSEEEPAEESEKHAEVTPEEVKAILAEPLTDEQAAQASQETQTEAKLPIEEEKPAVLNTSPDADTNEPSGLYNPDTGIGWESYLATRLNNEIERATASEIDLSLFIIKLSGVEKTSEFFKNVCNYLAIQFQFKDLLFEHKDDSIVAIKISMNVDEALKLADKLYVDICNIINSKNCRIGISSRSIRMVSGNRLILEAEQAIEHTEEASPVIAFRVDSEGYRQLMEAN